MDSPVPDEIVAAPVSRLGGMFDSVKKQVTALSTQAMTFLPPNWNIWLIAITCLVVLVAISRIITLQKSVTELQSRPIVDESSVRIAVRQHLEETVRAMEQQNKAQAMARQAEQQARDEHMRQMVIRQAQEQAAEAAAAAARAAEAQAQAEAEAKAQAEARAKVEEEARAKVEEEEVEPEVKEEEPPAPKPKSKKAHAISA
jgi:membrane protein involved in colicin uptake